MIKKPKLDFDMYVRTKNNGIKKVKALYSEAIFTDNHIRIENKDILKARYSLMELIEVGDYVNGSRVIRTNCKLEYYDDDYENGVDTIYDAIELERSWIYFEHEIESVVTKEQFESMEYKLENDN